jgi:hypothetical protein
MPDLPSGTVIVLFTGIEETLGARRIRSRYDAALRRLPLLTDAHEAGAG